MNNRTKQFHMEQLEDRQMMAGDAFAFSDGASLTRSTPTTKLPIAEAVSFPLQLSVTGPQATEVYDPSRSHSEYERDLYMGLPMLDSLPGAPRTLHLDFNGNFESDWWQTYDGKIDHYYNITTPVYSLDGNSSYFNADEIEAINKIWATVAEDFAPFNINVTTHYYGGFEDGQAVKVAIGGHSENWLVRSASGTSNRGSYLSSAPNTVFVFSKNFGYGADVTLGNTASHEAGHAFGLEHRSVWSDDGKERLQVYDRGTPDWTPIMGENIALDRTTWGRGVTALGPNTWQDEYAMLGGLLGFRADEPSLTTLTGNHNVTANSTLGGSGIINTTTDVDDFQFTTDGGEIQITVMANQIGANLLPRAELWSTTSLLQTGTFNGPTPMLRAPKLSVIDANLPAGTYFVKVMGGGDYGDVGQYTVSVKPNPQSATTNPTNGGGTVVGPVSPPTSTKTTSPVTKGSTSISTTTTKLSSSDGNSNDPVGVTMPSNSTVLMGGKQARRTSVPLDLNLELKDAAFESLYNDSIRR